MKTIAMHKTNENFICWEPVIASGSPFTAVNETFALHVIPTQVFVTTDEPSRPRTAGPVELPRKAKAADAEAARHRAMLAMAKGSPPSSSWFDEDFTNLRHPAR